MTVRLTLTEAEERIKRVRSARVDERSNFCALVERAGLDPSKDLRFGNFSGVNFGHCTLDGYDFTGAALNNCYFEQSRIVGATFSQCEFTPTPGRHANVHAGFHRSDDWDLAYQRAQSEKPTLPECFDKHIMPGSYFRDYAFAPLMKCVILAQPGAAGVKMAVESKREETEADWTAWDRVVSDRPPSFRDYVDALNEGLGLGHYFQYKIISSKRVFVQSAHAKPAVPVNIEVDEGITFVTLQQTQSSDQRIAVHKRYLSIDDAETITTGRLVRRMRDSGSDLPLDFDER